MSVASVKGDVCLRTLLFGFRLFGDERRRAGWSPDEYLPSLSGIAESNDINLTIANIFPSSSFDNIDHSHLRPPFSVLPPSLIQSLNRESNKSTHPLQNLHTTAHHVSRNV